MKLLFALALLVGLSAGALGQKAAHGDAEFRTLIERYNDAWSTMNPDKAALFYAKDATLVFYDLAPLKYTGWSEYDKGVRNLLGGFQSLKLTPKDDLRVTRRGNLAWTTVTFHLSAKMKDGSSSESDGRHTAIWERRGGKWLIVHEHVSAPLPG